MGQETRQRAGQCLSRPEGTASAVGTAESGRRRRDSRKKPSKFWLGLGIFAGVLVLFWIFVIGSVHRSLVTYENAQPDHLIERVIEDLREGRMDQSLHFTYSRFEDAEHCKEVYASMLTGKDITFQKDPASYDALAPVYQLYAQGTPVAAISLQEKSSQSLMFILTLQEWEITSVQPLLDGLGPYVFQVPDSCTVRVNGMELDDRERTGEPGEIQEFKYVANYVTVPKMVEYTVLGLVSEPTVEVLDGRGQTVTDVEREGNTFRTTRFACEEMDPELEAYVLKNAKDYSNFFSSDLPGSVGSINPIRHMFPTDSDYLELAENYRQHDMWMYSNHNTPTFSGEKVSNYIRYSQDFFSCDVYFDKKMVLRRTGEDRHDITNTRFYYVNIDDQWLIADMKTITDED